MNCDLLQQYQAEWQNHFSVHDSPSWLKSLRKKQLEIFLAQGFPHSRQEQWKYTNLASLKLEFFSLPIAKEDQLDANKCQQFYLTDSYRLVFVDGFFAAHLSTTIHNSQLMISSLAQAITTHEQLIKTVLSQSENHQNPFTNFNTACLQEGAFIYLAPHCKIDLPIQLLFITTEACHNKLHHMRNIILVGEQANVTIIEEYHALHQLPYWNNTVTQLQVDQEAKVNYIKLQQQNLSSFHIANMEMLQRRNSDVRAYHYSFGSKLSREDIHSYLNESGANLQLQGLYLPFAQQHIDIHTCIYHNADYTNSEEFFKGVAAKKSRAVFNGKIIVKKNIKKTTANLQNKNLLLTADCEINTKPELEIYAEDVKCRHGATVGQIDPQLLFYLRSRGISKRQAQQLLLLAFIGEIFTDIIPLTNRSPIQQLINEYYKEEPL